MTWHFWNRWKVSQVYLSPVKNHIKTRQVIKQPTKQPGHLIILWKKWNLPRWKRIYSDQYKSI